MYVLQPTCTKTLKPVLDNNRLLDRPGIVNGNRLVDKNRLLDKARTTKQDRIVMRLADLDVLVTFIKVWGSESTG